LPQLRRDHKKAEEGLRDDWLREKRAFEQRHRSALQEYVDTRLALAVERARFERAREYQTAHQRNSAPPRSTTAGQTAPSAVGQAADALSPWWPVSRTSRGAQPSASTGFTQSARQVVENVSRRTLDVLDGRDPLVQTNESRGLPRGIAVFLALLMLHVPSIALASGVIGVVMIRRHRRRLGAALLAATAILGIVIFFVLPW